MAPLTRLALQLPAAQPYAPFFDPLEAFARSASDEAATAQLVAFLASVRVAARTAVVTYLVIAIWEG